MTEKYRLGRAISAQTGSRFVADAGEHPADCLCCGPASSPTDPLIWNFDVPASRLSGSAASQFHASSWPAIHGNQPEEEYARMTFQLATGPARQALETLQARNKERKPGPQQGQPYICLGCQVPDGQLRSQILLLAASPFYQRLMLEIYHLPLALQCYFAQTYEEKAGPGPGGIIGMMPEAFPVELDTTAARAHKMWCWVDADEPGYLSEVKAKQALLDRAATCYVEGLAYLRRLPDILPAQGEIYPADLRHDLMALLGVPAMRRAIAETLPREFVLIDAARLTTIDQLAWSQLV